MFTISIYGNNTIISPLTKELEEILVCKRLETEVRMGKLIRKYKTENLFFRELGDSSGVIYTGLVDRVIKYLIDKKLKYTITDNRPAVYTPNVKVIGHLREHQDEFLAHFFSYKNGVFILPTGAGKSYCIEQICKALPDIRIVITTKRSTVLKQLHSGISKAVPEKVVRLVNGSKAFKKGTDIILCSLMSLHKIPPEWPQILICDECHNAAAPDIAVKLSAFIFSFFYGFTATPVGRGDNADIYIEALFGPIRYELNYQQAVDAKMVVPMDVIMYHITDCAYIDMYTQVSKERHNIWRNKYRNSKVVKIAKEFPEDSKILILCRTLEHLVYLHKLYPEASLVYGPADIKRFTQIIKDYPAFVEKPDVNKLKDDFLSGKIKKVIATSIWSEGIDIPDLTAIIRADAGASEIPSIQMGGRVSRIYKNKSRGILIDFFDDFHPSYANRSKARIKSYKSKKWNIKEKI